MGWIGGWKGLEVVRAAFCARVTLVREIEDVIVSCRIQTKGGALSIILWLTLMVMLFALCRGQGDDVRVNFCAAVNQRRRRSRSGLIVTRLWSH